MFDVKQIHKQDVWVWKARGKTRSNLPDRYWLTKGQSIFFAELPTINVKLKTTMLTRNVEGGGQIHCSY